MMWLKGNLQDLKEGVKYICVQEKEYESLKQQRDDLLAALKNARVSMKVMLLPQLDEHVANNSDILRIMDKSFEAAIAKCEA